MSKDNTRDVASVTKIAIEKLKSNKMKYFDDSYNRYTITLLNISAKLLYLAE